MGTENYYNARQYASYPVYPHFYLSYLSGIFTLNSRKSYNDRVPIEPSRLKPISNQFS